MIVIVTFWHLTRPVSKLGTRKNAVLCMLEAILISGRGNRRGDAVRVPYASRAVD